MNELEKKKLGNRIRAIRLDLDLTMDEFAKKVDDKAKSGTVANWETGKNAPNKKRLAKIAEFGNVSVNYLLHGSVPLKDLRLLSNELTHSPLTISEVDKLKIKDSISDFNRASSNFYEKQINSINDTFNIKSLKYLSDSELVLANDMAILLATVKKNNNDEITRHVAILLNMISLTITDGDKNTVNETRKAFNTLMKRLIKINN